jgi:hypothetical protein
VCSMSYLVLGEHNYWGVVMKTNYQVSPEEFIMAWETSESVPEVVEKLRRVAKAKNSQSMSKDIVRHLIVLWV